MKKIIILILAALVLFGCEATRTITETDTVYIEVPVVVKPTPNAEYTDDGFEIHFKYPTGNVKLTDIVYANIDNEEITLFVEDSSLVSDIKVKTADATKYFSLVDDDTTTYNVFCKAGVDLEHTMYLNRANAQLDKAAGNYIEIYVNDILTKRYVMTDFQQTD